MAVEVHIENIFPTPIYVSEININELNVEDIVCVGNGPDHLVLLSETDTLLDDDKYSQFKKSIDDHAKHFYHNILGYSSEVYPEMSSSWLVKSLPGQESEWHIHGNSIFSGVLYLQCNVDSGNISFKKDLDMITPLQPPIANRNIYNTKTCSLQPRKGMVVLFASTLFHKVEKNNSSDNRISIAFNYFLKGSFTQRTAFLKLR